MKLSDNQQKLLRMLPGVDQLLELSKTDAFFEGMPKTVVARSIRQTLESRRHRILAADSGISEQDLSADRIMQRVKESAAEDMTPNLKSVINATGVVVHTNLGRSLVSSEVNENLAQIAGRYSNLEYDLGAGKRGSRYSSVEDILCEISGAEAGLVVNNNAAAVLLCLETIARQQEVVVSRGELVEIGGSFRVPDVMAKSGAILREVGTTNRTHLRDYENALDGNTALMLKVHRSNYSVIGFTAEVSLKELVELGLKNGLPVMEDLGSGTFIDFSKYGLVKEPTVQESVSAGVDVVTFSGDKLLGGPQAGIIVGKKQVVERVKQNPLARALRIDKMTLAALETTLRLYRDEDQVIRRIPTLKMLTANINDLSNKAATLADNLSAIGGSGIEIKQVELSSKAGGGALPLLELPSRCLRIKVHGLSANKVEKHLRQNEPPIIGRIENDAYVIDPRTLLDDDLPIILTAFEDLLK
ncbi:L-seryl-tRNA(Sec) selenium transferase (EC [Olavius algarvensis Delta 1 endosymbiont]|nr:L-seryl-tRNA(Sec) selenium transferase (EC [Olavius algarvensis Delta 1 endosymbiont]